MSVNKAILIGHLGKDPEIRTTNSGFQFASFSVATSEKWTDKNTGEKVEKTQWHAISIKNERLVKLVEQYCRKGDKIYVEGQIEYREWEKDGVKRIATDIVLGFDGKIDLLTPKGGDREGGGAPAQSRQSAGSKPVQPKAGAGNDIDDDIPFSPPVL